jgi:putative drug exporter of the RND superfamily
MKPTTATVNVARWSARHPWRAIALWAVVVMAAMALTATVPTQTTGFADSRVGESGRAAAMIDDAGLSASPQESVVITARSGALDPAAAAAAADDVGEALGRLRQVKSVDKAIWSPDRDALLVPVTMRGTPDDAADHVDELLDATASVQRDHRDLSMRQAGEASLDAGINEQVGSDLSSGESLSLPITFAILLVAFGALIAAGIPVLLAFSSVVTSLGLYGPISHLVPDHGTTSSVVLLMGMAVGVDYSLFYLRREREERQKGHSTIDAIEIAAKTSGHAVVVSGAAVVLAMSGLFLMRDIGFAGLAVGSILVVVFAVLGSVTVLPALLAKLGHRVDRPRIPLLWRLNRRIGAGGISGRLLRPVLANPRTATLITGAVLVAVTLPVLTMKTQEATLDTLPQSIPAVQAYQDVQRSFPGEHPSIDVVLRGPAGSDAVSTAALEQVAHGSGLAPVGQVRVGDDGRTTVLTLTAPQAEGDPRNDAAVERLRDTVVPRAATTLSGATWAVGGDVAETIDVNAQPSRLPWVVAFVLALTLIVMGWTFRSVVIAALTTVLNLLSIGTAFGVMVLVFQHSWADGLLGYTSQGFLVDWVPVFCFVVLIGLSMDYHVFVLSRVREAVASGMPYAQAVRDGIRDTAGVVTSAAAVMVSVFAVFATLSMVEMKQMGIGLSVAILIDATLIRLVLLPAMLLLLERPLTKAWAPTVVAPKVHEPQYV